jgi:integrase
VAWGSHPHRLAVLLARRSRVKPTLPTLKFLTENLIDDCPKIAHCSDTRLWDRAILMAKPRLAIVAPTTENRTVTPLRRPNAELRTREHLTADEVEALMTAAKGNRYGHRDATMVLLAYRHGLRACELVDLEWSQVDFKAAVLHVRRVKKGTPATHPLRGDELRALRRLQREQAPASSYIFTSERGSPFSTAGFAKMVERAGAEAGFDFKAHPHMLRHACGFALANAGHDTRALQAYLGHKNIQHTVRYTELAPTRFKDFWR